MSFDAHSSTIKQCWEHVSIFGLRSTSLVLGPAQKRRSTGRSWRSQVSLRYSHRQYSNQPRTCSPWYYLQACHKDFQLCHRYLWWRSCSPQRSRHLSWTNSWCTCQRCKNIPANRCLCYFPVCSCCRYLHCQNTHSISTHDLMTKKKNITVLRVTHWMTSRNTGNYCFLLI